MTFKEMLVRGFLKLAVKVQSPRKLRIWQRRFFKARRIAAEVMRMDNALIVYHSDTGNTRKVAQAIQRGLERAGRAVTLKTVDEAKGADLYQFDLVCMGSSVVHAFPHKKVLEFIEANDVRYRQEKEVMLASPKLINKDALVFCTYSGPHCGLNEALPVGKYIRQFLEHFGFDVKDEWYEVAEFSGWDEASVKGRLGDIRGRPTEDDLLLVELKAAQLARSL
jgi:glycerol-3-phosphate cytidylyltransferase-like family protein